MKKLTGKFLVVGGVRFAQVADGEYNDNPCLGCAFRVPSSTACCIDVRVEREQGMDCALDEAHYEVAE